jgi:ribose 1,5-bisphosphokinase PhnN
MWQVIEQAKQIFEQIRAHKVEHRIFSQRSEKTGRDGEALSESQFHETLYDE